MLHPFFNELRNCFFLKHKLQNFSNKYFFKSFYSIVYFITAPISVLTFTHIMKLNMTKEEKFVKEGDPLNRDVMKRNATEEKQLVKEDAVSNNDVSPEHERKRYEYVI